MKDRIESLIGGLENCIENAKLRGDAYDVGYMSAMVTEARALLADGGKGEADKPTCPHCGLTDIEYSRTCHNSACSAYAREESFYRGWQDTAPQAECAPREAQPVGPRTTLNYDGTFDTPCAHCGGNGCFACLKSAAPTPERADADTAGAGDLEALLADVTAIDTWHRGSPSYEHDANWFKDRVIRLLEKRIAADASERADAEKDAARYRWILENADVLFKRAEFFNGIYSHYPANHEVSEAIDSAILAAKEKKS
jgi:hypothetical protein